MITTLEDLAKFLLDHADLIKDLYDALEQGVNKDSLKKTILDAKVAASDAQMKAALGLGV